MNGSEVNVKGECYRSQRKSNRSHDDMVILSLAGNLNKARCSCAAGENGYCNHTMGLLYLINHVMKLKAPTFPKVGACTENLQEWHKPRTKAIHPEPIIGYNIILTPSTGKHIQRD